MSQSDAPICFLFDFISPYAYLAWTQIHALAARNGRRVRPIPVLFAALLNAHGQKGSAEIPPKRTYIFKDCIRRAHHLGVPIAPPPTMPWNPLLALRVASLDLEDVVSDVDEARRAELRLRLIDGLFRAAWAGGGGVEDPLRVAAIASEAGLDGPKLVEEGATTTAKARLRRQTDEALAAGVFGVPTMLVDGELFWGADSLDHIDRFLRGEDPVSPALISAWTDIRPSATRRGQALPDAGAGDRR